MASECSGLSAGARGKHVHSDLKADTHAVSQRIRHKCALTPADSSGNHAGMDEQDIIDLLELQRLTRELLDHLTAMFPVDGGGGAAPGDGGWP